MRPPSVILVLVVASGSVAAEVDYQREVKPLLAARCASCHGALAQKGKLRLDTADLIRKGGRSGPAVVPGKSDRSPLIEAVIGKDRERMPPEDEGSALPPEQIALLKAWIDQGAKGPANESVPEGPRKHWAFQQPTRPPIPRVADAAWVTTPLDAFVAAKLDDAKLSPSPPAEPRTLVRRLHLDLTGLPPTSEEVREFLKDGSPDAYAKLVERLLPSPHFGERWGRHWLDLARFAESDGYENDRLRPEAWRYRDWVVSAVNRDLPFDQFTIEQLAGDLLPDATLDQKIAAGFHRHTLWNSAASADKEEFRTFAVKDRVDTTGLVWMGLTLGCAQCHAHKYDPISHNEYYQFYAFFNRTENADVTLPDGKTFAPTLKDVARETRVHVRGNFLQAGPVVVPGIPAFLPPLKPRGDAADRLDLARWLVDPAHPLTARVAANHVWQHLFGTGLVTTPENFGLNGSRPRHPELLDWLATEFIRSGWSRKALIRTIVLSSTYRQSSRLPEGGNADPNNELWGRQNRFRVDAEIVRDLSLGASGLLSRQLGGPSIVPPFPEGLLDQKFTNEALKMPGGDRHRRGIYIHVQRTLPHPTLAVFDGTDGNSSCPRRDRTVTPLQALTLLNDPVFVEAARALGERVRRSGADDESRLRFAFEVCLSRQPTGREMAVLTDLIQRHRGHGSGDEAVWFGVARTLLNLEEFTTRE